MRLIDAYAFKNYIRGALKDMRHLFKDNGEWAEEVTEEFCKDIDEQPTIEERKTGKWITVQGRLGNEVECDKCHSVFWYWMGNYRFCPSCGADMRGENDA